jgi:hypothetical protein
LQQNNGYCPITKGTSPRVWHHTHDQLTGDQFLELLGMDDASIGRSLLFIGCVSVGLQVLFYCMLRWRNQLPKL